MGPRAAARRVLAAVVATGAAACLVAAVRGEAPPPWAAALGALITLGLVADVVWDSRARPAAAPDAAREPDGDEAPPHTAGTATPFTDAVAAAMQEGMVVLDGDGVVVDVNRRLTEITGVPPHEIVGGGVPLPFWPRPTAKRAATSAAFTGALAGDGRGHEAEFVHATGRRLWLTVSAAMLGDGAGHVVTFTNVTARHLADHERHVRESTDPLTGLANHSVFQEHLRDEEKLARETGQPLSLVLFDIDHLKRINQVHGHRVGDEVLREASRRVLSCVHPTDLFARVGGEKFAVLMPGIDGPGALATAERIRAAVGGLPVAQAGQVTLSAGAACTDIARDSADLYRLADGARYWAKSTGRDRCVLYHPDTVSAMSTDEYQAYIERQGVVSTIHALARAVDAKDASTREHSDRVASLAGRIALELGWSTRDADLLYEAGLVHDVGKIGIPDAVLFKPGRLTPEEYELIKKHAPLGAEIVAGALSDTQVAWVRAHHERWDGRGYPAGLRGDEIPKGARILALADAWDVMTVARIYSEPRSLTGAVEECRGEAGKQFWTPAVDVLERLVRDDLVTVDGPSAPAADELVLRRARGAADPA